MNDLAEKMKWFIDQPEKISECGRRAYIFAKDNFLSDINTNKMVSIYKNLQKPKQYQKE